MFSVILDLTNDGYEIVNEELSIFEFRMLVQGVAKFETGAITEMGDEHWVYNSTDR